MLLAMEMKIVPLRVWEKMTTDVPREMSGPVRTVWGMLKGCWAPRPMPMPVRRREGILGRSRR
jgi:hypothetical protein